MYIVTKDGIEMGCHDKNQLAAFLSCGWVRVEKKVAETPAIREEEPEKTATEPVKRPGRRTTKR